MQHYRTTLPNLHTAVPELRFAAIDDPEMRIDAWPTSCPIGEGVEVFRVSSRDAKNHDSESWSKGRWLRYRLRNRSSQQAFTVLLKKDMRFPEVDILCAMRILVGDK